MRSRNAHRGRLAHVGIAGVLAASVAALTHLLGDQVASGLRSGMPWLRDRDLIYAIPVFLFVIALASLAARDARVQRAFAPMRAVSRAAVQVPTVVLVTGVVALAAGLRIALGAAETLPRVLGDELIYVDLAKGFALHGGPYLRGQLEVGYSLLYPLFASPAYRFASDGAEAFAVLKVLNSVAMALAAVPVFFLGRRILSRGWSVGVAALSVAVPWMEYASRSLTEPLFYVLFAVFALVFVRMLERPTWQRQLVVLLTLAALGLTRPQAAALAVSVIVAIVLHGLVQGSLRRSLDSFSFTLVALGVALAAVVLVDAVGVTVPGSAYRPLLESGLSLWGIAKWTVWNLATYQIALGVIAFAAFPLALVRLLRRDASEPERAVGVGALALLVGILLSVALLSASTYGLGRLHERSLFYVTPVILICFAYWLSEGLPRPPVLAVPVAVAAVALPATLPEHVLRQTNELDGPTAFLLWRLYTGAPSVELHHWALILSALGAGAFLLVRRPAVALSSVVFAFAAMIAANDFVGPLGGRTGELAFVDHALRDGGTATLVHVDLPLDAPCAAEAERQQQGLVVAAEYFNTRIDRVVHVNGPIERDGVASPELAIGADGTLLDGLRPYRASYVVVDSRLPVAGTPLARLDGATLHRTSAESASLTLWKVTPPLRLLSRSGTLPPRADGRGC